MDPRPTVLITGAAGQDGTYLARSLLADGRRVVGTISPHGQGAARAALYAPGMETVVVDVRDAAALGRLVADVAPAEIYNLAGVTSVARSWDDPATTFASNTAPVATLIDACLALRSSGKAPRLFQASSAEAAAGESPYARSKAEARSLVEVARREHGLFAVVATLFNHESPLRDRAFVTRKITAGAAAIALGHAESLELGNLDVTRDWGFAGDFVEAMRLMLGGEEPLDLEIGTGVGHTLRDLVETAFAAAGVDDVWSRVTSSAGLMRPADLAASVADPGPARERIGWKASVGFEELVARMVQVDLARLRTGVEDAVGYL
ncbi:MAG TPA: GDP-mannose 4,6-dehydratase [Nocardioides sp.]|nr:GDP-mannose 4,6-dehydratase [Nocardioides sp.]